MAGTVENYRQIVQRLLTRYSQIPYVHDNLTDETIFDHKADRYLLVTVGWQGRKRINTIVLHLDIRDNQVWVQCNNTDQDIVKELNEQGIAAEDIILPHAPNSDLELANPSVHALVA